MEMVSTSAFGIFVLLFCAAWDIEYTVEQKFYEQASLSCSEFRGQSIQSFTIKYNASFGVSFLDVHYQVEKVSFYSHSTEGLCHEQVSDAFSPLY